MGAQTEIKLVCDICGKQSKGAPSGHPQTLQKARETAGWIRYDRDHPIAEREWIDTCICPSCLKEIDETRKRLGVPING